jgi:uncharacterized metal-binding protein
VHQKASIALAAGFALGQFAFQTPGIEYAIGALVGIMLTPDLDVDAGNIANQIIREKIGGKPSARQKDKPWFIVRRGVAWIVGKAWDGLWHFYRKSVKHGSPLSHFPVISTLFRLAYLFLLLIVLPYFALAVFVPGAWDIGVEIRWWIDLAVRHHQVILGLIGSDVIHWGLDVMTKENSKNKNKTMILGMPLASNVC